jgi:hypothetical protein
MQSFESWFATSPLAGALRVFLATILALAVASWAEVGSISLAAWQTWVIAAAASALPPVLRWLNPADGVYGLAREPFEPFDVFDDDDELRDAP